MDVDQLANVRRLLDQQLQSVCMRVTSWNKFVYRLPYTIESKQCLDLELNHSAGVPHMINIC